MFIPRTNVLEVGEAVLLFEAEGRKNSGNPVEADSVRPAWAPGRGPALPTSPPWPQGARGEAGRGLGHLVLTGGAAGLSSRADSGVGIQVLLCGSFSIICRTGTTERAACVRFL